jgi:hypothetical protein
MASGVGAYDPIKCETPDLAAPRGARRSIATMRRSRERVQKKAAATQEDSPDRPLSQLPRSVSIATAFKMSVRAAPSTLPATPRSTVISAAALPT